MDGEVGREEDRMAPQILRLSVLQAENLAKKDIFGASDPYVLVYREQVVTFTENGGAPSNQVRRTAVKKKTLNPEWNETFELEADPSRDLLVLDVYDENRLTRQRPNITRWWQ